MTKAVVIIFLLLIVVGSIGTVFYLGNQEGSSMFCEEGAIKAYDEDGNLECLETDAICHDEDGDAKGVISYDSDGNIVCIEEGKECHDSDEKQGTVVDYLCVFGETTPSGTGDTTPSGTGDTTPSGTGETTPSAGAGGAGTLSTSGQFTLNAGGTADQPVDCSTLQEENCANNEQCYLKTDAAGNQKCKQWTGYPAKKCDLRSESECNNDTNCYWYNNPLPGFQDSCHYKEDT